MATLQEILKIIGDLKVDELDAVFEAMPDRLKKFAQASKRASDEARRKREGTHKTPTKDQGPELGSVEVTTVEVSDSAPDPDSDLFEPDAWEMGADGRLRRKQK